MPLFFRTLKSHGPKRRLRKRRINLTSLNENPPHPTVDEVGTEPTSVEERVEMESNYSDSSEEESEEFSISAANDDSNLMAEIKIVLSAGGLDLHLETVMNKEDLAFAPQNSTLIMRLALFLKWSYDKVIGSSLLPELAITWFAQIVSTHPLQVQGFCKHLSADLHFAPGTVMNYCDDLKVSFHWLTLFSPEAVSFQSRQSQMSAFLLVVINTPINRSFCFFVLFHL